MSLTGMLLIYWTYILEDIGMKESFHNYILLSQLDKVAEKCSN